MKLGIRTSPAKNASSPAPAPGKGRGTWSRRMLSVDPGLETILSVGNLVEWFWSNVEKTPTCWLWTAKSIEVSVGPRGNRIRRRIHAVAWRIQTGQVPNPSLELCHTCDTPRCIRRSHLWEGTHTENMRDSMAKGRASPPPVGVGKQNPMAKLTELSVQIIKLRLRRGESQTLIASDFPVTNHMIYLIAHGKKWKHVP